MRHVLFVLSFIAACSQPIHAASFGVDSGSDPALAARAKAVLPRLVRACPGLDRYAADLGRATISDSSMRDFEGGITLEFRVSDQPEALPAPLNVRSKSNNCFIDINRAGTLAYISKRACHSICTGAWGENDPDLMGREFRLSK